MGRVIQFQIKSSETLDDRWDTIENVLDKQSGLAIRVMDDSIELHTSDDMDNNTLIGLLEIFKTQLSSI